MKFFYIKGDKDDENLKKIEGGICEKNILGFYIWKFPDKLKCKILEYLEQQSSESESETNEKDEIPLLYD
jgi:hypothetical protein